MKVHDIFRIKGRGQVAKLNEDDWDLSGCPAVGDSVVRKADGATWTVRGQERMGWRYSCRFLLSGVHDVVVGDELEVWRPDLHG